MGDKKVCYLYAFVNLVGNELASVIGAVGLHHELSACDPRADAECCNAFVESGEIGCLCSTARIAYDTDTISVGLERKGRNEFVDVGEEIKANAVVL